MSLENYFNGEFLVHERGAYDFITFQIDSDLAMSGCKAEFLWET
jgi:hypothetical protein